MAIESNPVLSLRVVRLALLLIALVLGGKSQLYAQTPADSVADEPRAAAPQGGERPYAETTGGFRRSRIRRAQHQAAPEVIDTPQGQVSSGQPYSFETTEPAGDGSDYFADPQMADPLVEQSLGHSHGHGAAPCEHCGETCAWGCGLDHQRLWVRAQYLLWWSRGIDTPPLVTTSADGTSAANSGILGLPSTSLLYPTDLIPSGSQSGGRVRAGYWFDCGEVAGLEASYMALGQASSTYSVSELDYPILARPYVNVTPGTAANAADLIAYPNLWDGSITATSSTRLDGIEFLFRHALAQNCDARIDLVTGWRYNRLDDQLTITDDRTSDATLTQFPVGTNFARYDQFSTRNTFNGFQLGFVTEVRRCRWWFETRTLLALGNNQSLVTISGETTRTNPNGSTQVTPEGLLAQSTNIGQYRDNNFAIVPQLDATLGFEVCCGLWATVGYSFVYWSQVARPGDQIDPELNLNTQSPIVGLVRPSYTGALTDFWAQGLNFGLAYRF